MKIWIYKDGAQAGPYSLEELADLGITRSTKVWCSGMPRWCEAETLPELAFLFQTEGATPPPAPTPVYVAAETTPQFVGGDSRPQEVPPCPPSHLVWSIVLTLLCCSPFAIAAIVTGMMSASRYAAGSYSAARRLSEATEWLIMLSLALGALPSMLMLALL